MISGFIRDGIWDLGYFAGKIGTTTYRVISQKSADIV